jgi:SAM-dependent methyltransferase
MRRLYPATVPVRSALRNFVDRCASQYDLEGPFLDLGAGYRSNEPEICARALHDYYTVDINPLLSPDFVADAQDLSFLPQKTFGTVLCTELLEHVRDPHRVPAEICRVLRPDGRALVSVPFSVPIHRKPPYQEDYWRFTPDGLVALFGRFALIEMEIMGEIDQPVGIFSLFGLQHEDDQPIRS